MRSCSLRNSLRRVTQAWIFGALWMYIVTGAVLTRFAQQLHMPAFGFGILAALPFAGALVQLPASYFIERYGYRKGFFITVGIIHRLLWALVALIPWVLPEPSWWKAMLLLVGLSWAFGHMHAPIWVSWMADLVPARIRGRYFSRRSQVGQLVGMVVTVTIGYVLDHAQLLGMLETLSLALLVAAVAGAIDFLFFLPVPAVRQPRPNPTASLATILQTPLRDRNFLRFLGFTSTLTFAVGFLGQFIWLHVFDVAGMSNIQANVMLVFVPLVVLVLFYPLWGKVVDRAGRKPVQLVAGLLIVPGAAAWIFVSRDQWLWGYLVVLIATAAWPGIEIANFNMMLAISDQHAGQGRRSGYVAVNSAANAIAGIASGLCAGLFAEALRDWRTTLWGWTLTYHGLLFLISAALRVVALGWLLGMTDPGAATTRTAFRYLGTNLYSNLQQAIFLPGRVLWQVGKWTFTYNPRGPSFAGLRCWWRRRAAKRRAIAARGSGSSGPAPVP